MILMYIEVLAVGGNKALRSRFPSRPSMALNRIIHSSQSSSSLVMK